MGCTGKMRDNTSKSVLIRARGRNEGLVRRCEPQHREALPQRRHGTSVVPQSTSRVILVLLRSQRLSPGGMNVVPQAKPKLTSEIADSGFEGTAVSRHDGGPAYVSKVLPPLRPGCSISLHSDGPDMLMHRSECNCWETVVDDDKDVGRCQEDD